MIINTKRGRITMFTHIIWDFDGTLFDTYPAMGLSFSNLLKEKGHNESTNEILKYMKISMSHAYSHYKDKYKIDDAFIEIYSQHRHELELKMCKPFDGIQEVCEYIYNSGRRNYLYTHRGESAITFLKQFGLYDYFSDFVTLEQGFERKPSPDAINYLLKTHQITPQEAIMIGDRDLDILSGKNAGISACYFTESSTKNPLADYTITDFKQLLNII